MRIKDLGCAESDSVRNVRGRLVVERLLSMHGLQSQFSALTNNAWAKEMLFPGNGTGETGLPPQNL